MLVKLYLPLDVADWNGRFQAMGDGGYAAGNYGGGLGDALATPAAAGYSTGWTGGGHAIDNLDPSSWALTPEGHVNHELVANFASRSLHDLAVVGKAISTIYYDREPAYSYFNGCSGGGRQGYMEAQQYPDDFDGILANCPAISWPLELLST